MTFSLLSILGGAANVASFTGKGEQDPATLTQGQNAPLFENIMQGQAALSPALAAQQALLAKAQGQGIALLAPAVPQLPEGSEQLLTAGEEALAFLQQLMLRAGQNLPEGAEIPEWFRERLTQMDENAQPLSAQELSELAAETGLPAALLLAAVEQTPLANPALAAGLTGDDITEAANFLKKVITTPHPQVAEDAQQPQQVAGQPNTVADKDVAVDAEVAARFDKLLAKLAQLPQGEGEEKSAYAQLAQMVQDAKALRKPAQSHEQQRPAVSIQPQQEKSVATPVPASNQVEVDFADAVAEEGSEVKVSGQQSSNASSTPRTEGAGQPTVQAAAGQENQQNNAKAATTEQPRFVQRSIEAPLHEVTVHLAKAVKDGVQRMEIQLRPESLGKIEVAIETDKDGLSRVQITAEKRETLDVLQRDARNLERVLQDAGVKTENGQLSFNLRGGDSQQGRGNEAQQHDKADDSFAKVLNGDEDVESKRTSSEMALGYDAGRHYRLDLDWGVDISV